MAAVLGLAQRTIAAAVAAAGFLVPVPLVPAQRAALAERLAVRLDQARPAQTVTLTRSAAAAVLRASRQPEPQPVVLGFMAVEAAALVTHLQALPAVAIPSGVAVEAAAATVPEQALPVVRLSCSAGMAGPEIPELQPLPQEQRQPEAAAVPNLATAGPVRLAAAL